MNNFRFSIGKILFSIGGWYVFFLFLYDSYIKNLSYNIYIHLVIICLILSSSVIIFVIEENFKFKGFIVNNWLNIVLFIGFIFSVITIIAPIFYIISILFFSS